MSKPSKIKDARFANFETDPRFRLPSKRKSKTTIDKRFAGLLKDDEFTASAKVDRYGRKIKSDAKKKALQQLYQTEEEEEQAGEDVEVEDDDVVRRELEAAEASYDPARGGGFSSSESESESDEENEEDGDGATDNKASMQRLRDEQADVETGEITNRLAVVNLDWDHLKSQDLMALFSSFLPASGGRIEKVTIYPSEFGKERMQREELEGPPKEIFKPSRHRDSEDEDEDSDSESESESEESEDEEEIKKGLIQEGDDRDFDSDALRSYQLDRLRYYYAVMIFSDKATAQKIYEATDGTEYQTSSNFIDLRFIPDDVQFDDEPRDECDKVPEGYKPVEFITDALQHSKVKLTWDLHPEEAARKQTINKAFTGSRNDLEENDLKAYLASDSEDDDAFDDEEDGDEPKLSKREQARKDMRAALGLSEATTGKTKGAPVGDMQITFTPALTESKNKVPEEEETTIEKYKRKERERKESKRQAARARREGLDPNAEPESASDEEEEVAAEGAQAADEDLGFDDPFFNAEEPKKKPKNAIRKEDRLAKRAAREAEEKEKAEQKAQLQLLMAAENDGDDDHLDHFDMNEITRAEKQKNKNKKYKKKGKRGDEERAGLQEGFKMNVADDRFKAVFESHEYAIDPSNPKFKSTEGMQQLLEEGRKKRKAGNGDEGREVKKVKKPKKGVDDIGGLVASVKLKSGAKSKSK